MAGIGKKLAERGETGNKRFIDRKRFLKTMRYGSQSPGADLF